MERYGSYKDSGVEWIGEIPKKWEINRLKMLGTTRSGMGNKTKDDFDDGYPFVTYGDVYRHPWGLSASGLVKSSLSDRERFDVRRGDVFVTGSSETIEELGLSSVCLHDIANATFNGFTIRFRPNDEASLIPEYSKYLFRSEIVRGYLTQNDNSITRANLSQLTLGNLRLVLPSAEEQRTIATFLDAKTAEIDGYIADTEHSIDLLAEYRRSVISEVVTKGLDSDTPMRESGVEWIGEIPEGWLLARVKNIASITNGSDPKTQGNIPVFGSGGDSFKTCGEYKEGPVVLLGRKGATLNVPHFISGRYWNVDTAFDVRTNDKMDLRYFFYLSMMFDYGRYLSSTALPSMTQRDYGDMKVPIPSTETQREIASYLDAKTAEIDSLVADKRRLVERLREYRASLVSEAVTGKFKVPGVA